MFSFEVYFCGTSQQSLFFLGLALITTNEALLWTDGRYFLQAEKELSDQWRLMRMGEDPAVEIWMADVSVPFLCSLFLFRSWFEL